MALVDAHYKFISVDIGSMDSMGRHNASNIFQVFSLCDNIMWPYPKRNITSNFENKIFNYRLSKAPQTVECIFCILASRFRVFKKLFEIKI